MSELKQLLNTVETIAGVGLSKQSLSIENFDKMPEEAKKELDEVSSDLVENLDEPLEKIVGVEKFRKHKDTFHQLAASAVKGAITTFKSYGKESDSTPQLKAGETFVPAIESYNLTKSGKFNFSKEYFDSQANNNALTTSIAFALMGLNQDPTTSAIFPTYLVENPSTHVRVEVATPFILSQSERNGSGQLLDRKEVPITQLYADTRNFNNESTNIYPYVRDPLAFPTNSNPKLVTGAKQSIKVLTQGISEDLEFAPIKIDEEIDMLNLGQTPKSLLLGMSDVTDAIDRGASIDFLTMTNIDGDIVKIKLPPSRNRFGPSGGSVVNEKQLVIHANDIKLPLKEDSKVVYDTVSKTYTKVLTSSATLAGKFVKFTLKMNGSLDLTSGRIEFSAKKTGYKLYDAATKLEVVPTPAEVTYLDSFQVTGYMPALKRTNSNLKEYGTLVETKLPATIHEIGKIAPVHVKTQILGASETEKIAKMQALQAIESLQKRKKCFDTLEEAKDIIEQHAIYSTEEEYSGSLPAFTQISKLFIPTYIEEDLDVAANVNSLTSAGKEMDVSGLIVSIIRNMVSRMYADSKYSAALQQLGVNSQNKPHVLIVTTPQIGRFLISEGDTRLAGHDFNYTVVTDIDERVKGKLYIVFTTEAAATGGVVTEYDRLAFGVGLTCASMFGDATVSTNGTTVNVTFAQAIYNPVVNIPVMGYLNVTNIDDAIASKTEITNRVAV